MFLNFKSATVIFLSFVATSCVSLVEPGDAPIAPVSKTVSPVGLAVTDHRTEVSGGNRGDRYYGRCRLGMFGIPTPIFDPKGPIGDRLVEHMKAGFTSKGVEGQSVEIIRGEASRSVVSKFAGTGAKKVLVIVLNNVWIDFANPMFGKESIMYFDATAEVWSSSGKLLASSNKSYQKKFKYDVNDSLFNQAVIVLQPEFSSLIANSGIQRALR